MSANKRLESTTDRETSSDLTIVMIGAEMRRSVIALAMAVGLFGCRPTTAGELQAGAATVEITPPVGFPMWGYANRHDAPSTGVASPLFARAVVIDDGTQAIAIVSLDLGRAPTGTHTMAIRARIEKAGIGQMFLVASHTHHGPVLE